MLSSRVIVGAATALVVVGAVGALGFEEPESKARSATPPTKIDTATPIGSCGQYDLAVALAVRRPSRVLQSEGEYAADPRRPVATIVVRNIGTMRCLFDVGWFHLTISDRTGMMIGEWGDDAWLATAYSPGSQKQFSLPAVFRCDRPGPVRCGGKG